MITATRLDAFLRVMEQQSPTEWEWTPADSGQFWYVSYQNSYPPFEFFIEFNEEMLYVQYVFRDFRIRSECWAALYRMLLRLNEELSLVKFGLTTYNNITLLGELPAAQFSLDVFQNLLRLMVHYLEQLYWELGVIATSPALAPFLTGHEASWAKLDQALQKSVTAVSVEQLRDKADQRPIG